ncbi:hypothetical protein [Snodgrassella alvi]|uniref:hypothetical protein n=1 Tax=Snodgrassella alvi TaxID=1196083 RepID=UPI00352D6DBB
MNEKYNFNTREFISKFVMCIAYMSAHQLKINPNMLGNIEKWISFLIDKKRLDILIIDDNAWSNLFSGIDARSIPSHKRIEMPEKFFRSLYKQDWYAIYLFLHELGHVSLEHNKILHKQVNITPLDPEYQADLFAVTILILKLKIDINKLSEFSLQKDVIEDFKKYIMKHDEPL